MTAVSETTGVHTDTTVPILELDDVGKRYGNVHALRGVNITVRKGEVTCVLGDNGAGKSTLIKIVAGLHEHTEGVMKLNGEETTFSSPRVAQQSGIATVYQDLALAPLMSVWRNFFLGNEVRKGLGLDIDEMKRVAGEELTKMGIVIPTSTGRCPHCPVVSARSSPSPGAIYFGANVVILDEPTAALGVKQSGVVLKYILKMRDAGLGVIFITHNPHHAYLVGNHFIILKLGRVVLDAHRSELTLEQLTGEMAGGQELEELSHELAGADPGKVVPPAPEGAHEVAPPTIVEAEREELIEEERVEAR